MKHRAPERLGPDGPNARRYTLGTCGAGRYRSATGTSGHHGAKEPQVRPPAQPPPGTTSGGGQRSSLPTPAAASPSALCPRDDGHPGRAYFLNAGLSKRGADDATAAGQVHGFATGTYPVFGQLDAKRFTSLLSTAELAIGTALVLPMVPAWLAGTGLTAFALGTPRLVPAAPGMRQEGSLRPTQQGIPLAKDAWMVGIGLALMVDEVAGRARRS
jgi:hypothetical protein